MNLPISVEAGERVAHGTSRAGGMIQFLTWNEAMLRLSQDAGLLRRSLKCSSRFRTGNNAIRRVQTYLPRCRVACAPVIGPGFLQKCDRLPSAPNDVKTIIYLQFDVRIPDADHGVLRGQASHKRILGRSVPRGRSGRNFGSSMRLFRFNPTTARDSRRCCAASYRRASKASPYFRLSAFDSALQAHSRKW